MAQHWEPPTGGRELPRQTFEYRLTAGTLRCIAQLSQGKPVCTLNAVWRNETGTATVTAPGSAS